MIPHEKDLKTFSLTENCKKKLRIYEEALKTAFVGGAIRVLMESKKITSGSNLIQLKLQQHSNVANNAI